ncbi:hypothetical protein TH66_12175 [Carbonactinospora thermoautotrophica]|uniref:Uncharacterized protein n=1 Tax=Carbonactinospora thermoautotrophica TaxID=1469144 RepID=A0A132MX63_9ACTN|nr:hypothetical protein [Carbonactinospora thermoautotrophica]KWX02485.1 hypothetical protein LI90_3528 [Carbonactinospora thermoautotrophica]KWX03597.1 hypothetical protein TH66_12175 [Carbonactinospora thermoautotrophica]KWX08983.1 hypothetical protein TR74_12350 [Carbonactinospora thermoautotrophica]
MTDGFYSDPAAIKRLGNSFAQKADELESRISTFLSRADEIEDGFGVLTESEEALQAYRETLNEMVEGLRLLRSHLSEVGSALSTNTANNYTASEESVTKLFRGDA